ncbi:MAG: DUF2782 domain-containing protein [Mariprofundaceae bacterium]|nr:DUF2782 domain-containing protein [Mariprofundaceae bacterium]
MNRHLFFLLSFLISVPVFPAIAADQSSALPPPTGVQNTPEAKETVQPSSQHNLSDEFATPEAGKDTQVRVFKRKDGATVEEYSLHGRVYMIKVSPAIGTPPYYLYDNNGDGSFKRQRPPGGNKYFNPPEWVIKRF